MDLLRLAAVRAMTTFEAEEYPTRRCVAPGFPSAADQPAGFEIIEHKHQVVLIYEILNKVRRIYTDGHKPGADTLHTRMGYSVGPRVLERISREENELTIEYTLMGPVHWEEPMTRRVTYR